MLGQPWKANAKNISGYFSVKVPLASEPSSNYGVEKIISNETSKDSDAVSPPDTGSGTHDTPCSSSMASIDPVDLIDEIPPLTAVLDEVEENIKLCKGFQLFSKSEFYSIYPFGVHSSHNKDNEVFKTFVPFDGVVFSTKCRDRQFKLFENQDEPGICNDCNALKSLNCVKLHIERAGLSYAELRQCQNSYLNHVQLFEKLEQQKATLDKYAEHI